MSMASYSESLAAIRKARADRDAQKDTLYRLRLGYLALKKQQKKAVYILPNGQQPGVAGGAGGVAGRAGGATVGPGGANGDNSGSLDEAKKRMDAQQAALSQSQQAVLAAINGLFAQQGPQQLIAEWNAATPIVLLPLRLETKFKTVVSGAEAVGGVVGAPGVVGASAGAAGGAGAAGVARAAAVAGTELWVRIYPDEIAINTHEKVLTQQEIDYGTAYWKALRGAVTEEDKKKAWRLLTDTFGATRSAWVAQQTKPINWDDTGAELQFPTFPITKPDTWTEAPHTRVMPDRFVLIGYRGGAVAYTAVGPQVTDILVVGPSPLDNGDSPSITRDPVTQKLILDDDLKWTADFSQAEKQGLAFRVPMAAQAAAPGFDQLLVVGIKVSADQTDGKGLLEDLLNNHHYSRNGLSIVAQGTPTNNTENQDSGYTKLDPFQQLSYFVETGPPLFQPVSATNESRDGQRLADYLGIGYDVLQYVAGADGKDYSTAIAMNKALYAATLGYYTHSMLNQVMDEGTIRQLRDLFTNYVTGRGPLSAIRVGNQPYAVLLTSDFSRWTYPVQRQPGIVTTSNAFLQKVYSFLSFLQKSWTAQIPQLAHISKTGDAGANLLQVLGLQPTSVEYFQRVAYSFDSIQNTSGFLPGGKYFIDAVLQLLEKMSARQILTQFGYTATDPGGGLKPTPMLLQLIFQHFQTTLDTANLIEKAALTEDHTLQPYDTSHNYIDWLLANAGDATALQKEDFGGAAKPTSLLYMLLKHSLLIDTSTSIYYFLQRSNIVAQELVQSRKYMNMSSTPTFSHWEVFDAPVNKIVTTEPASTPLYTYLHSSRFQLPADGDVMINLDELKWGLGVLTATPTAALERVLAEHLDTLTFRLDSWQTALFQQRFEQQRQPGSQQRMTGSYLGAYGYLENVRPETSRRTLLPDDTLPVPLQEHTNNLYAESGNGGYVHTSSLNHATAAAILRNGYLTHASSGDSQQLAVNLSSERVRRANYLVDGIRNGQTLEVLLGYQFERGLHDWSTRPVNPVILSQLVPDFRTAFPIKKTKVPQQGNTTGPEETITDFSVVNGLDLAQTTLAFPWGMPQLSALSAVQQSALQTEKDNILNTLDALRDLLTTESAYQLALGNFERAAAVLQAVSDSHLPPDIEVIRSARGTSLSFTNRVLLPFDVTVTANPWPSVPVTEKAAVEPAMNQWLGSLLGDPAKVCSFVRALDAGGNVLEDGGGNPISGVITLQDLQLQPLDVIYLITSTLEASGTSELETRVRYVFAQQKFLGDDVLVSIAFADTHAPGDPTLRSFAELLPLADYLRKMVTGSKILSAREYQPASQQVTTPTDNPGNVNVAELQTRVQAVFLTFEGLFAQLDSAVTAAIATQSAGDITALRNALKAIADAGAKYAFPQSAFGSATNQLNVLVTQGQSQLAGFATAKSNYNDALTKVNAASTTPDAKVTLLTGMIKGLLGADFVVLPRFSYNNPADVAQAYSTRAQLLAYAASQDMPLAADEWLHGASLVRPKMHDLEMIRLLNDTMNAGLLQLEPIQLPWRANDSWLAVAFPTGTTVDHDTLSLVQYTPQGFDATREQCGLLIDDWTESIPNREEVTGLTFNYNQPNSAPPQALLLAVHPQGSGSWSWDDLTGTILDTFARAKRRAVEPDMIDQWKGISTLLPAIVSEFSTGKNNISLDLGLNIQFVLEQVAILNTEIA